MWPNKKTTMHIQAIKKKIPHVNVSHNTVLWQNVKMFMFRILTIDIEHTHCPSDEVPSCSWPKEQWRTDLQKKKKNRQKPKEKKPSSHHTYFCPGQHYHKVLSIKNFKIKILPHAHIYLRHTSAHGSVAGNYLILFLFKDMKCFTHT